MQSSNHSKLPLPPQPGSVNDATPGPSIGGNFSLAEYLAEKMQENKAKISHMINFALATGRDELDPSKSLSGLPEMLGSIVRRIGNDLSGADAACMATLESQAAQQMQNLIAGGEFDEAQFKADVGAAITQLEANPANKAKVGALKELQKGTSEELKQVFDHFETELKQEYKNYKIERLPVFSPTSVRKSWKRLDANGKEVNEDDEVLGFTTQKKRSKLKSGLYHTEGSEINLIVDVDKDGKIKDVMIKGPDESKDSWWTRFSREIACCRKDYVPFEGPQFKKYWGEVLDFLEQNSGTDTLEFDGSNVYEMKAIISLAIERGFKIVLSDKAEAALKDPKCSKEDQVAIYNMIAAADENSETKHSKANNEISLMAKKVRTMREGIAEMEKFPGGLSRDEMMTALTNYRARVDSEKALVKKDEEKYGGGPLHQGFHKAVREFEVAFDKARNVAHQSNSAANKGTQAQTFIKHEPIVAEEPDNRAGVGYSGGPGQFGG
jgi:hypothetical protein